jgi:hypothetical protein
MYQCQQTRGREEVNALGAGKSVVSPSLERPYSTFSLETSFEDPPSKCTRVKHFLVAVVARLQGSHPAIAAFPRNCVRGSWELVTIPRSSFLTAIRSSKLDNSGFIICRSKCYANRKFRNDVSEDKIKHEAMKVAQPNILMLEIATDLLDLTMTAFIRA